MCPLGWRLTPSHMTCSVQSQRHLAPIVSTHLKESSRPVWNGTTCMSRERSVMFRGWAAHKVGVSMTNTEGDVPCIEKLSTHGDMLRRVRVPRNNVACFNTVLKLIHSLGAGRMPTTAIYEHRMCKLGAMLHEWFGDVMPLFEVGGVVCASKHHADCKSPVFPSTQLRDTVERNYVIQGLLVRGDDIVAAVGVCMRRIMGQTRDFSVVAATVALELRNIIDRGQACDRDQDARGYAYDKVLVEFHNATPTGTTTVKWSLEFHRKVYAAFLCHRDMWDLLSHTPIPSELEVGPRGHREAMRKRFTEHIVSPLLFQWLPGADDTGGSHPVVQLRNGAKSIDGKTWRDTLRDQTSMQTPS